MSKKSLDFTYDHNSNQNERNSFQTIQDLNKTKSEISLKTFYTKKSFKTDQNHELLNSTRAKLLTHLNEAPKRHLTKADLFPL